MLTNLLSILGKCCAQLAEASVLWLQEFPGDAAPRICPATVCDKLHVGYMVKYWLQIDDGEVRLSSD